MGRAGWLGLGFLLFRVSGPTWSGGYFGRFWLSLGSQFWVRAWVWAENVGFGVHGGLDPGCLSAVAGKISGVLSTIFI